jgi:hypothetical protein
LKFLGRNSYKWWQKKTNIEFIIFSIMLLIWFVIGFELGNIIFPNTDTKKIVEVCVLLKRKNFQLSV